jgi:hypothetical protein
VIRDVAGAQGGAGDLDHRADLQGHAAAAAREDLFGHAQDDRALVGELLVRADQGHHHLGVHVHAGLGRVHGGLVDGRGLHLGDLGERDAQAAATVTEHGVGLGQVLDAVLHRLRGDVEQAGDLDLRLGARGAGTRAGAGRAGGW